MFSGALQMENKTKTGPSWNKKENMKIYNPIYKYSTDMRKIQKYNTKKYRNIAQNTVIE